ncbi:hypothetical protein B4168_3507 [Anoxybacillus flavithermus]|nr:hypothetical protein B4168_3507 [Anoxybacillus flavithermus]OAO84635.1 hypothetical protein GT23_3486 [Parageobacillus thermoglucosidasius]
MESTGEIPKKARQIYMGKSVLKSGKKGFTLWMSHGKIIYLLIASN